MPNEFSAPADWTNGAKLLANKAALVAPAERLNSKAIFEFARDFSELLSDSKSNNIGEENRLAVSNLIDAFEALEERMREASANIRHLLSEPPPTCLKIPAG